MSDYLRMLDRVKPPGPSPLAIREQDLRARAAKYGTEIVTKPFYELVYKLNMLDEATREHVVSHIARGEPVAVYRPSQPGEPAGGVPMAFIPVALERRG